MTGADAIAHAKIGDVIDRARYQYRNGHRAIAIALEDKAIELVRKYIKEKEHGQGTKP